MTKSFLPYGRQSLNENDIQAVNCALSEEIITRGKHVDAFEAALTEYCNVKYAVAFNSGTAALQACYFAANTGSFDKVFTSPNSFFSTSGAALASGACLVFIDIDRNTGNINLDALEPNLNNSQTRGKDIIVPIHFSGIPVDMVKLEKSIRHPDTVVIEDAAHAIGSKYLDGSPVGCCKWSQMTVFSFHPVKTITSGEGGAVTTNDPEIFHRLKRFRNNGIERDPKYLEEQPGPWHYEVYAATGNYNFTDMQGALALSQLKRIDQFIQKRRRLVSRYRELLKGEKHIKLFDNRADDRTAFHLFVVQIDFNFYGKSRKQVMEALMKKGIGSQVHYIPIYRHPVMRERMGEIQNYFPETEAYFESTLSLPLFFDMTIDDVEYVIKSLKHILK